MPAADSGPPRTPGSSGRPSSNHQATRARHPRHAYARWSSAFQGWALGFAVHLVLNSVLGLVAVVGAVVVVTTDAPAPHDRQLRAADLVALGFTIFVAAIVVAIFLSRRGAQHPFLAALGGEVAGLVGEKLGAHLGGVLTGLVLGIVVEIVTIALVSDPRGPAASSR